MQILWGLFWWHQLQYFYSGSEILLFGLKYIQKAHKEKGLIMVLHLFWKPISDMALVRKHVVPLTFPNIGRMVLWPTVWPAVRLSLGPSSLSEGPGDVAKIVTYNMSKSLKNASNLLSPGRVGLNRDASCLRQTLLHLCTFHMLPKSV